MVIHRGFASWLAGAGILVFCAATVPLHAQPFLVKNINQVAYQVDSTPLFLADLGETVVFTANDPEHSGQLWASDGTTAGTTPICERPGRFRFPSPETSLAAWGGGVLHRFHPSRAPALRPERPVGDRRHQRGDGASDLWGRSVRGGR